MTDSGHIKCPCRHCGGHIEFPTQAIGMTVHCPHCGQKTLLGRAGVPPGPSSPPQAEAPAEVSGQPARRTRVTVLAAIVLLAVAAGAWWWRQREQSAKVPPPQPASLKGKMAAMEAAENAGSSHPGAAPAPARPAQAKAIDDLKAGPVTLEKARSGNLLHAVGTIRNESDHQRFGVRVEIGLTDAKGGALPAATDYTAVIEPRQEWRFRALVLDAKAAAARVISIREEP